MLHLSARDVVIVAMVLEKWAAENYGNPAWPDELNIQAVHLKESLFHLGQHTLGYGQLCVVLIALDYTMDKAPETLTWYESGTEKQVQQKLNKLDLKLR